MSSTKQFNFNHLCVKYLIDSCNMFYVYSLIKTNVIATAIARSVFKKIMTLVVVVTVSANPLYVGAQDWLPKKDYPVNSLGEAMQEPFRMHFNNCNLNQAVSWFTSKDWADHRDYIAVDITKFLPKSELKATDFVRINKGPERIFMQVFKDVEIKTLNNNLTFPDQSSLFDSWQLINLKPSLENSHVLFSVNCKKCYHSETTAGAKMGGASLDAAGEIDGKQATIIVMKRGDFSSPIAKSIRERNPYAYLSLWSFYLQNPTYIGDAKLISQFNGTVIRRETSNQTNKELNASITFNASIAAASISNNSNLQLALEKTFSAVDLNSYIKTIGTSISTDYIFDLPGLKEITEECSKIDVNFEFHKDYPNFANRQTFAHWAVVKNFPKPLAKIGLWEIENSSKKFFDGDLSIEQIEYSDADQTCRFLILGKPAAALFTQNVGTQNKVQQINLKYTLRSKVTLKSPKENNIERRLQLKPMVKVISTDNKPTVAITQADISLSKIDTKWKTKVILKAFVADNNDVNFSVLNNTIPKIEAKLADTNAPIALDIFAMTCDDTNPNGSCEIIFQPRQPVSQASLNNVKSINVEVELDIKLNDNTPITKTASFKNIEIAVEDENAGVVKKDIIPIFKDIRLAPKQVNGDEVNAQFTIDITFENDNGQIDFSKDINFENSKLMQEGTQIPFDIVQTRVSNLGTITTLSLVIASREKYPRKVISGDAKANVTFESDLILTLATGNQLLFRGKKLENKLLPLLGQPLTQVSGR